MNARSTFTTLLDDTLLPQVAKVAGGGFLRRTGQLLILGIGNAAIRFEEGQSQHLPFVDLQLGQGFTGEPVAPNGKDEGTLALLELGCGQSRFAS